MKSTAPAEAPASSNVAANRGIPGTISVLRWQDEQAVATLLARAFVDDPLVIAICGAPAPERHRRMWWSFRMALRSHCLARQPAWLAVDASATPLGVALVTRAAAGARASAQDNTSPSDALFVLRGLLHVGPRMALRGATAARMIASQAPPGPFTYLRTLGVDPDWHGRGLGSRLVEHVVRTAPTTQPVYLETAKEQNLAFYTRQGFTRTGEFSCLGVPVWRLIRAAQEPA